MPLFFMRVSQKTDSSASSDTVPIFAQAAGAKLAYVAEEAASPSAQAILTPSSARKK